MKDNLHYLFQGQLNTNYLFQGHSNLKLLCLNLVKKSNVLHVRKCT